MKPIPELIATVERLRPNTDVHMIHTHVPKLRKLAQTLAKRTRTDAREESFEINTRKFLYRARRLAEEIGCDFVIVAGERYYLALGVLQERLA